MLRPHASRSDLSRERFRTGARVAGVKMWFWTAETSTKEGATPSGAKIFLSPVWSTSSKAAGDPTKKDGVVRWTRDAKAGSDGTITEVVESVAGGPQVGDEVVALPEEHVAPSTPTEGGSGPATPGPARTEPAAPSGATDNTPLYLAGAVAVAVVVFISLKG